MTRATVCALVIALQRYSPTTAEELAAQCLVAASSIREWLYEFESVGIVKRVGKTTQDGKSSGRSSILWAWVPAGL